MRTLIIIFIVAFKFQTFAQIEATTNDGRKVVLNKNGTWKYAKTSTVVSTNSVALTQEALEFSKTIVRSFFARDCSVMLGVIAEEVYSFESTHIITNEMKEKLCMSINKSVNDSSKTYNDYESDYKMEMLTKDEFRKKIGLKEKWPEHFKTNVGDLFFLGFESRSIEKSQGYIWGDLYAFMVRKVNGKWQIKAILS